ncbi:precorrin-3B C(17)-methyltransferase [Thermobrachium celere]|uniref:Cobalt-precorrin-3b C17-methyltransferase n=1 Tax=Thermobrachium celere DSM 8682 TaxID=941824 RepID=R7RPJ3_9CLOT|nr:precorrin-3B C(17)-methyltransferase [Thermobrachium celere]CDF57296.1 Cobalt-precorrin-3b C17-methyltransferase [Thermobrachium celere DSM 8682]
MGKIYVVSISSGNILDMSKRAMDAIKDSDIVVGYTGYISLIEELIREKEVYSNSMKGEIERCKYAINKAREGKRVSIISSGDACLYGMAGPIYEMADGVEVEYIPGITAAFLAASQLGAPIMHDMCTISLSDLLTPFDVIERRIKLAAEADFVIALYNPKSLGRINHLEYAMNIIRLYRRDSTPVGIVKNALRQNQEVIISNIRNMNYDFIDMSTVIIVGNSQTYIKNGYMITPRGYRF